jgi:hypothetical protein
MSQCRNAVLKLDGVNVLREAGSEDGVQVSPWPLIGEVIVVCRNRQTKEVLAADTFPISTREELPFTLRFSPEKAQQFREKARLGKVVMDYYYHYRNVG